MLSVVPGNGRLGRPLVRQPLVRRRRLVEMLDAGVRRSVTLVCAGPGWGKTTLVAAWAESRAASGPIAWLTLNARHNDPRAFWCDLVMALRMAGAVPCGNPLERLDPGGEPAEVTQRRVTAGLDALPSPVVVVLDDFHEIDDPQVIIGLAGLLHSPPPPLRLVLVTRGEPSLPLHRFRAGGDLTEIRARHLAFRAPEAAELPAVHRRRLPVDELVELLDRTEGWVVGLQLVADVVAEGRTGELRAVSDYLLREVVAGMPAKIRQFLIRTSVPDAVCGPLAEALTGETHSRRILERLENANVFVTGVDDRPGWFRYHPMLRDVLRHQLQLDRPGAEAEVNLLAAQWYAREQSTIDALRHATAAQDWPFLGCLVVDRAIVRYLSAERRCLLALLHQVPPELLTSTPELALCAGLLRYDCGDRGGVATMLDRVRALLAGRVAVTVPVEMTMRLMENGALIRPGGDMPALVAATTNTLKRLTSLRTDQLPTLLQYRAATLNNKGAGLLWMDRPDHADRYLWAAATAGRAVGAALIEVDAMAHLALLVLLQGSLREAAEFVLSALEVAGRHDFETTPQAAAAYLTLALVELESDRVAEAQEALRRGLHAGGEEPPALLAALATLVRAQMLLASGEPGPARALVRQARGEAPRTLVSPLLDRWLRLVESEADLRLGAAREVMIRYDRPLPRGILTPAEQVCLARAQMAAGDRASAEDILARVRDGADHVAAVTAWIATAFDADAEGHGNRSLDALSKAVLRAERDGIRRPFRKFDARRMAALLERRRWVEEQGAPAAGALDAAPGPALPGVSDVLSERERDVLRYLPTVLTAGEIADNLNISVNTVKAHMRSIYRKLSAVRRREAVVRARQLGLL